MTALWDAPREFSLAPFWFWNDALDEAEIIRQIADFEAHGVYGFVIHPRVGLPRDIGWMSDRMMHFMRVAVEEAARRAMTVILYDEGMYPSGSSSGQVVAANPDYHCRCMSRTELKNGETPQLEEGQTLVAVVERTNGDRIAVIDRPVDAYIRGLHYIGEGPAEDEPPAADLLNPASVATFIHLVYDRYAEALGDHFRTTVRAIFTDEPGVLGRCRERDVVPGTRAFSNTSTAFSAMTLPLICQRCGTTTNPTPGAIARTSSGRSSTGWRGPTITNSTIGARPTASRSRVTRHAVMRSDSCAISTSRDRISCGAGYCRDLRPSRAPNPPRANAVPRRPFTWAGAATPTNASAPTGMSSRGRR